MNDVSMIEQKDGRHDEEEEPNLSEHTVAMREASLYCEDLFDRLFGADHIVNANGKHYDNYADLGPSISTLLNDDVHQRRSEAYEQFWSQTSPTIPILSITTDQQGKIREDQVWDFQDKFQKLNLPCLLVGLDRTHFDSVNRMWRTLEGRGRVNQHDTKGRINRLWFLNTLGDDYLVPLRYHEDVCSDEHHYDEQDRHALDSEGRAVECKTCRVTMKEWISSLEEAAEHREFHDGPNHQEGTGKSGSTIYYLKDWHLHQELLQYAENDPLSQSLYDCPDVFEHDMLNSFLRRFTRGDYRFCYWGPSLSSTPRHADVLHSFSWSYNVMGTKEWTFYGPDVGRSNKTCNRDQQNGTSFSVRQETGQAIFVPATWQHTVVNLTETISINHNWITMANLDLTWQCLCTEMVDIRLEMQRWSTLADDHDMEASENILRGCVGLDVTSFLLMTLVRLLELELVAPQQVWPECSNYDQTRQRRNASEKSRLAAVVGNVLWQNKTLVQLTRRLQGVLQSDSLAAKVERMATKLAETFTGTTLDNESKTS